MADDPYTILTHSGDLKIRAIGSDFTEAMVHASSGLLSQIIERGGVQERELRNVEVKGDDETEQTVGFLNEIPYLVYTKKWLPAQVKQLTICGKSGCETVEATLSGEPMDPKRHELKYDIKAVTYHEFEIKNEPSQVSITFVCDL